MDREKSEKETLLCAADHHAAGHGFKGGAMEEGGGSTPLMLGGESPEHAYLPTAECALLEGGERGRTPNGRHAPVNNERDDDLLTFIPDNYFLSVDLLQELLEGSQAQGFWLPDHPLPLPSWQLLPRPLLQIPSLAHFERMASLVEMHLQRLLEHHPYDTVTNFLHFYQEYKQSGCPNLKEFFQSYTPVIKTGQHTCVGLALELWKSICDLNSKYPSLSDYFYLVSCEEHVDSTNYVRLGNNIEAIASSVEKEHVLLALRFSIAGRMGVLLCDPGYHIGRVVTVMQDQAYPHTGWFVQSSEAQTTKEYRYVFARGSDKYVEWQDRATKDGVQTEIQSLIYISRPYLTAVDVTERRNLVYNFRSLLARDPKGHLIAGIYFKLKEQHDEFTVFYLEKGQKRRIKLHFSEFTNHASSKAKAVVDECNEQMGLANGRLRDVVESLATAVADEDFLRQLLDVNRKINAMAEDN